MLLDLGSAALAVDIALDGLAAPDRALVRVTEAPFVEGAILAAVAAAGGRGPRRRRDRGRGRDGAAQAAPGRRVVTRPGAVVAAAWMTGWADAVHERREWLTDLDAAIGDGDHGINLDRGLAAVAADLGAGPGPDDTAGHDPHGHGPAAAWASSAAPAARSTGAPSSARARRSGTTATTAHASRRPALAAAIEAITGLGKAVPGEKTMLDALVPALDALRATATELPAAARVEAAAAGAEAGALATVPLLARKGRASYLGERSVGHMDPGAASAALLVRCLATAVDGR